MSRHLSRRVRSLSVLTAAVALSAASMASGQTIEGQNGAGSLAFGEYQFKLATQTNSTGFGDLYSQLDGMYVNVRSDGSLQLLVAGNLEGNYNGLMIWMDNGRPGASSLGNQPDRSIGSIAGERGYAWGTRDGAGNGSIFANDFDPARLFTLRGNNEVDRGPTNTYYNNYTDTSRPSAESNFSDYYLGSSSWATRLSNQSGNTGAVSTVPVAYNYSHFGIDYTGTITQAFDSTNDITFANNSPVLNNKGYEVLLQAGPWGLKPGEEAKIMAIVTGSSGDYGGSFLSNQSLPALASGTPNIGNPTGQGDRVFNSNVNGITFLTIPTPTLNTSGLWSTDADWSTKFAPNGLNTQARLNASSVLIGNTTRVGTIYLNNPGGVTISKQSSSGGYDLRIATIPGDRGVIRSASGNHTIDLPLVLESPVDFQLSGGSTVTVESITTVIDASPKRGIAVSGGGTVFTSNYVGGPVFIENNSGFTSKLILGVFGNGIISDQPEADVRAAVGSWYANGAKTGNGIGNDNTDALVTLAAVSNDTGFGFGRFSSYLGYSLAVSDILLKTTYLGDTDLSGSIDALDVNAVLNGWTNGLTGWANGDTNYDGVIDGADYANVLAALVGQGAPFAGSPSPAGAIPEPAALGLLAPAALLLGRRRR